MWTPQREAVPLVAAAPVLAVLVWWAADDGGYFPRQWMPGALLVLGLLAAIGVGLGARLRAPPQAAAVAIACLAGYAAWSYLSILWSDAPGAALEGSHRTLLYLATFALASMLPWTPRTALVALGVTIAAISVVAVVTLLRAAALDDLSRMFVEGRLVQPVGYFNATAALWTLVAVPALVLASRPEVRTELRPVLLGCAGLLFAMAVLSESRGWLYTLPVVALGTLVLCPGRARIFLYALPVAVAVALTWDAVVEPYRVASGREGELRDAVHGAARAVAMMTAALVAAGALLVTVERRRGIDLRLPPRILALVAVLAMALTVAGVIVAADGDPIRRVNDAWTEFKDFERPTDSTASRFATLGSTRYDFWRVAVAEWRRHPLAGLGQDNFAQQYLADRHSDIEEPRWVHSLPLRLLAHTGAIGALLFTAFLVAAVWAAIGGSRSVRARVAAGAALLPGVVWVAHGSVDWLWEFPVLTVLALGFAGIAAAISETGPPRPPVPSALRIGACGIAIAAALAIVPAYVAELDVDDAGTRWASDPDGALDRLDQARRLNPLSARASLVEGVIAVRRGRPAEAARAFGRAARREPRDWFARFQLGLLASQRDDPRAAAAHLRAARASNPLDPLVRRALRRVHTAQPIGFAEAERELLRRVAVRDGRQ